MQPTIFSFDDNYQGKRKESGGRLTDIFNVDAAVPVRRSSASPTSPLRLHFTDSNGVSSDTVPMVISNKFGQDIGSDKLQNEKKNLSTSVTGNKNLTTSVAGKKNRLFRMGNTEVCEEDVLVRLDDIQPDISTSGEPQSISDQLSSTTSSEEASEKTPMVSSLKLRKQTPSSPPLPSPDLSPRQRKGAVSPIVHPYENVTIRSAPLATPDLSLSEETQSLEYSDEGVPLKVVRQISNNQGQRSREESVISQTSVELGEI